MNGEILILDAAGVSRRVRLSDYLDAACEEQAAASAHAWIKALRHLAVDGQPLRRRFTYRGDSLWWFAELYLHKQQTVLRLFRTVTAVEQMIDREKPVRMDLASGDRLVRGVASAIADARQIRWDGPAGFGSGRMALLRLDLRARALTAGALLSRLRPRTRRTAQGMATVVAFVHTAFWRSGADHIGAESYIGPVLQAIEARLPTGAVQYVGLGPSANFSARRWWHSFRPRDGGSPVVPIEAFAPLRSLDGARRVWRARHAWLKSLWTSVDIRRHARIGACDAWPLIREELAGIAWLQWPWSARAMDEAGAALHALGPRVAITYAEAGGWGRALMLECRRRGICSAGLQHGFIYRHWLNYRHEPDEMAPDPDRPEDAGFPRPSLTLLFDRYAASHLEEAGRFPPHALAVTGSPRLDRLVEAAGALTTDEVARAHATTGARPGQALILLVAKYREAGHLLPDLIAAVASLPDVHLAIKTHPAETPDDYDSVVLGQSNVRVLPSSSPLAPLLRASRVVATMNSTVALDAAVLGIPALVLGLANNLTPFVEAGMMAGATADVGAALRRILYDEEFRQRLARDRSACLVRFGMGPDGRAADRSAEAILAMTCGLPPK